MREGRGWSGNERNCCFLNIGRMPFANVAAATGLDLPDDGRALAVTDWDGDGRLDLWMSCRTSPRLRLLRNNVPGPSNYLAVKLRGVRSNRDAIGARLELYYGRAGGSKIVRALRAGEGFLAQSSQWIHFGLGSETDIDRLVIRWPGSDIQSVTELAANRRYVIEQGKNAVLVETPATRRVHLRPEPLPPKNMTQHARIVLAAPLPMPELTYVDHRGTHTTLRESREGATLINLWARWCAPCIDELDEFRRNAKPLRDAGLNVLALNVDLLEPPPHGGPLPNRVPQGREEYPVAHAVATEQLVRALDVVQRGLLDRQRPLTLPTSFLLDANNRVTVIYKGPVSARQLLSDLQLLGSAPESLRDAAVPFAGRWHNPPSGPDAILIAMRMIEAGDAEQATRYLQQHPSLSAPKANARQEAISTQLFLARLLSERGEFDAAVPTFEAVLRLEPDQVTALVGLSFALLQRQRTDEAAKHLDRALQLDTKHAEAMAYRALAAMQQGRTADAIRWYRDALQVRPGWIEVANNLAWILATDHDPNCRNAEEAIQLAEQACQATGYQNLGMLDTLAAAYAEGGKFDEAAKTIQQALPLATSSGQADVANRLRNRLSKYQSQQPFRTRVKVRDALN